MTPVIYFYVWKNSGVQYDFFSNPIQELILDYNLLFQLRLISTRLSDLFKTVQDLDIVLLASEFSKILHCEYFVS